MLSIEEKKQLRLQFWTRFETYAAKARLRKGKPRHFILNNTGIRQLKLKLHFEGLSATESTTVTSANGMIDFMPCSLRFFFCSFFLQFFFLFFSAFYLVD